MWRQKGARLWLEPAAYTTDGKLRRVARGGLGGGTGVAGGTDFPTSTGIAKLAPPGLWRSASPT